MKEIEMIGQPPKKEWMDYELIDASQISHDTRFLLFRMEDSFDFIAGQYLDIRVTTPNGNQAVRSYSILSSPAILPYLELAVQLVSEGELSPILCSIPIGTKLEMRGPIGGHFIWDVEPERDVLFLAGGVGVVPLLSMFRYAVENSHRGNIRMIYAARTQADLLYYEEIKGHDDRAENIESHFYLSREEGSPPAENTSHKHLDQETITHHLNTPTPLKSPLIYICGSTRFVGGIGKMVREIKYPDAEVRVEGFG